MQRISAQRVRVPYQYRLHRAQTRKGMVVRMALSLDPLKRNQIGIHLSSRSRKSRAPVPKAIREEPPRLAVMAEPAPRTVPKGPSINMLHGNGPMLRFQSGGNHDNRNPDVGTCIRKNLGNNPHT